MNADTTHRLLAALLVVMVSQLGCYNRYFITKDELEKLESQPEVREVVTVQGDCSGAQASLTPTEQRPDSPLLAQAAETGESEGGDATATDASKKGSSSGKASGNARCVSVPVSTSNPISVVTDTGEEFRVTPFNFEMSQTQLVSPEYDLLLSLDRVKGAQVRQFSTWKTIATFAGAAAVSVGTFVTIGALSDSPSFE